MLGNSHVKIVLHQHQQFFHLAHAKKGRIDLSAVAEHATLENHRIEWKKAEVIDHEKKTVSRQVKEALWIHETEDKMNKDRGLEINTLWLSLLTI